jgi:Lsr2
VQSEVGGTQYEIDLNRNAKAFRKQLVPFIEHARRAGRRQRRRIPRQAGDIRAWTKEQGIVVSGCGRIRPAL